MSEGKGVCQPLGCENASLDPSRPFWELVSKVDKLVPSLFVDLFVCFQKTVLVTSFAGDPVSNIDSQLRQPWKVLEGIRCTWNSGHSVTSFHCFPTQLQAHKFC